VPVASVHGGIDGDAEQPTLGVVIVLDFDARNDAFGYADLIAAHGEAAHVDLVPQVRQLAHLQRSDVCIADNA
jgi:hypothetical protein